jgi:NADPH:quinone reductase
MAQRKNGSDAATASGEAMRAVVVRTFGPPDVLEPTELPVPEPGACELSVDVAYAGVGFVDALIRSGAFPFSTPFVPGIEVTGRVRAVGDGVDGFRAGEPVAALLNDFGRAERVGGYAEVAIAHASMAMPVEESTDLRRLTAVLSNGVAGWIALHELARIRERDRVLILGAGGGLGATSARLAALHPVEQVIGVVGHDPSRGPSECTAVVEAAELGQRLDELTADGTVDVVVDPVGGPQRVESFQRLAPFGRHLVLGNASGDDRPFSGDEVWLNSRSVSGLSVGGIAAAHPRLIATALAAVISLVDDGSLQEPEPATAPLKEAEAVHRAVADRRAPTKTLLAVQ